VRDVVELTRKLIERPSVTPADEGCQDLMIALLEPLGFDVTRIDVGDVRNFWARRGSASPLFVFAGHTDVVPPGPESKWRSPPFEPTEVDGVLFGRGAADMKGALAAMIVATQRFLNSESQPSGSIGFLITSDEEGPAVDGTRQVVDYLAREHVEIDWCLVGEPSSTATLGDVVRNGRRGSLNGTLRVSGVQGHVAYPELANNPIHAALGVLEALCERSWDEGNDYFPATSFQISNINAGTGVENVIPGELDVMFNFRFNSEQSPETLKRAVTEALDNAGLNYAIDWRLSGMPFITEVGTFTDAVSASVAAVTGQTPQLSTSGGTSDGRFIAPTGTAVVELGPVNATIHKIDEQVVTKDLELLADIYAELLRRLLPAGPERR
jgi:succinyl-diaminopimelate desuccinylase